MFPVPKGNQVTLLRVAEGPLRKTSGGLLLPAEGKEKKQGEAWDVLAVGPQARDLRPGERVVINTYAGTAYKDGEHVLRLVSNDEVLAALDPSRTVDEVVAELREARDVPTEGCL